jgi:hypothetical protein
MAPGSGDGYGCQNPGIDERVPSLAPPLRTVAAGYPSHVLPILRNQIADVFRRLSRIRTDVGDCAAEPNIVTNVVHPVRILEHFVDIDQTYPVFAVDASSVMGLLMV